MQKDFLNEVRVVAFLSENCKKKYHQEVKDLKELIKSFKAKEKTLHRLFRAQSQRNFSHPTFEFFVIFKTLVSV